MAGSAAVSDGPQCQVCGKGKLFPMMPKTKGYKFGTICDACDHKKQEETDE